MPDTYYQRTFPTDQSSVLSLIFGPPPRGKSRTASDPFEGPSSVLSREMPSRWRTDRPSASLERTNFIVSDDIVYGLATIFRFENRRAVPTFIKAHPVVVNVLLEAFPKLTTLFGEDATIVLRLVEEPDDPGEPELFGVVQTTLAPDEALRRLYVFDSEWWLEQSLRTKSSLNFNIEYL